MPDQQQPREDVQRDFDTIRRRIQQAKDPQEQQRLKKQLQQMSGQMPFHTPITFDSKI